jgi:hypothetical protein
LTSRIVGSSCGSLMMPKSVEHLHRKPGERALEKQRQRDEDAARLRAGTVGAEALQAENNVFASLDLRRFRIDAIGTRVLKAP